ncbi:MAG: DUF805 domain-containing protein [Succinivibrionaceae bacterium]|nr:DUF805 domain-containing protein [Succinivibrionaceae bacterium]
MFCRKCGAQIPDGSAFCHKCGTPVSGGEGPCDMYSDRQYGVFTPAGWFAFKGRMSRLEWWGRKVLFYLMLITVIVVIAGISAAAGSSDQASSSSAEIVIMGIIVVIGVVAFVAFAVSGISIDVRRLHDLGVSGWWVALIRLGSMIPYVGFIVAIGGLIWLGCFPGTQGQNRFGPDPRL